MGQLWGSLETIEPLAVVNIGPGGALVQTRTAVHPDAVLRLPAVPECLSALVYSVPVQLFAHHVAMVKFRRAEQMKD